MSLSEGAEATIDPEASSWQADAEQAKYAPPPEEPLVDEATAEVISNEYNERQAADPLKAFEYARAQSEQELAERYKLDDPNIFKRFSGQCRAFFAGEHRDLALASELSERAHRGEINPTEFDQIIKDGYRLTGREGLRRLGKVIAKTGVSGGIGAAITVGLGGAIAAPVFLSALGTGAVARGAFEIWRHYNPKEGNARAEIIKARAAVFSEALKYQDQTKQLARELSDDDNPPSPERQKEIMNEYNNLREYLVRLTNYESAQLIGPSAEQPGLAEVRQLSETKMAFERKREKTADLITAGASFIGGAAGHIVQGLLANHQSATEATKTVVEKVHGFMADFDKDGISHFADKINPADVAHGDPGFIDQLRKAGGYVFHYNAGEAMTKATEAITHHAHLTQAVLKDGSTVHILQGMGDNVFQKMLAEHYPAIAKEVGQAASTFWKEVTPLVGAQLMWLASGFHSKEPIKTEVVDEPVNTDSVSESHLELADSQPEVPTQTEVVGSEALPKQKNEHKELGNFQLETLENKEAEEAFAKIEIQGDDFRGKLLTPELLKEEGLLPKHKIHIGDLVVWFSSSGYELNNGRIAVIAYVENKGKLTARSYYRSNSQGVWRYLPDYRMDYDGKEIEWYGKGHGEESITLPIVMQKALSEITKEGMPILKLKNSPNFIFAGTAQKVDKGDGQYYREVESVPKRLEGDFYTEGGKTPPEQIRLNEEQSPDFSKLLTNWEVKTSLYGQVSIEVFPSKAGNLKFMFCKDSAGRVWVGGIEDEGETQSTGLKKNWINGGDLTTPAYEYDTEQTGGYGNNEVRDGPYIDMYENYLQKIPVIQDYLKERSVQ